jgi:hypothetical protein
MGGVKRSADSWWRQRKKREGEIQILFVVAFGCVLDRWKRVSLFLIVEQRVIILTFMSLV